jgi:hypothetical protein
MPRRGRMGSVYSVYHAMEDKGFFDVNKANASAVNNDGVSIYDGPVQYPKMLYHPKGELACITQGIMVTDRDNRPVYDEAGKPKFAGAVWGVKYMIVDSEAQEAELVGQGWHFTEAQALRANPETAHKAPPKSQAELQKERIAELEKKLAESEARQQQAGPAKAQPAKVA